MRNKGVSRTAAATQGLLNSQILVKIIFHNTIKYNKKVFKLLKLFIIFPTMAFLDWLIKRNILMSLIFQEGNFFFLHVTGDTWHITRDM